jgi:hypothetical protein
MLRAPALAHPNKWAGIAVRRFVLTVAVILTAVVAGCSKDSMGTGESSFTVTVLTGSGQFGNANGTLQEPLRVVVVDAGNKRPADGVTVRWSVVNGSGAQLTPTTSTTGTDGIASTTARLGPSLSSYTFQATTDNITGVPARFEARAVLTPAISAVTPLSTNGGDTITITGTNFSTVVSENTVLFSGFRGTVASATATQLRVVVPRCLPSRTAVVQALLGAVGSNTQSITVNGANLPALRLTRGQSILFTDANDLQCQRLDSQSGLGFLLVAQNASDVSATETFFELIGLRTTAPIVTQLGLAPRQEDFASNWELRLRMRERAFTPAGAAPEQPLAYQVAPPDIGDRRDFKVFDKNERFTTVTAEVKAISDHAIIYQDINAPASGFTTADFQRLGSTFDDPIYDTDVATFGAPSDIDANGKVIILLSPVVNELTPRNSAGFISGFFFGCDLQTVSQCSGTNTSEIFYLMVPDPTGRHGDPRSVATVLQAVQPVLAHEFQHMINFSARHSLDALWLSEGLAHMAEEVVGAVFATRGESANAQLFRQQNNLRATLYLRDSTSASLIADELPGSLQLRGGSWLMVMYLAGQHGNTILRTMTQSTNTGVQNVTTATGRTWSSILSDWAVALWADGAPELQGVTLKREQRFLNINLRAVLTSAGQYPLAPTRPGFVDFNVNGTLRASSQRHVLLLGSGTPSMGLAFSGQRGGPFSASARPQLTILRVQ